MTLCFGHDCGCGMCERVKFEAAFYALPQAREVGVLFCWLWRLAGKPIHGHG